MKCLIINADDFGMSREVNEGVKKGIEAGMITSVSVMVNMPYFKDAVAYLKKHPEVSVGLHFNITEGFPVLPRNQTTTLIRESGHFFYYTPLLFLMLWRKVKLSEIEAELTAQYKILESKKLPISHIDSHHHIHLYPQIFKIFTNFAQKNKVNALRCRGLDIKRFFYWAARPPTIKQFIITIVCIFDSFFVAKSKQFYDVKHLYDIAWDSHLTSEGLCNYLRTLPDGSTEIICHPAVLSKTGNEKFLRPRYNGLSMLLSKNVKRTIDECGIQLITRVK